MIKGTFIRPLNKGPIKDPKGIRVYRHMKILFAALSINNKKTLITIKKKLIY